jgi:hypothetical protein
MIVILV